MTELFQELGEGGGGEVVGLVRIATKVIQGFIYLKLNYLSSGAPIGCMVAFPVRMPTLDRAENHCSNREAGELGEQKVNFKSQPNKEKGYLCVPPPVVG